MQPKRWTASYLLSSLSVLQGQTVALSAVAERDAILFSAVGARARPRHAALPRWHFDMARPASHTSCRTLSVLAIDTLTFHHRPDRPA